MRSLDGYLRNGAAFARSLCERLRTDQRGVTAIIFAIALIPIAVASGASIDMGRAYIVKSRLAYALDAAGLAVGSAGTNDEDELDQILQDYFDANYPEGRLGTAATPEMEFVGSELHLSVSAEVETTLMNLVGISTITVSTTSVIVRETKGLEVAMVLDITGSMSGDKIVSLKEAANDFIDILFGQEAENDKVRISIVPFSQTVNIGTSNSGFVKDNTSGRFSPTTWGGCIEERVTPHDTNDEYVNNNNANGRWRAYGWFDTDNSVNNWPPVTATKGPNKNCPGAAILPLTSTKQTLVNKIAEMQIGGRTHVPIGAVWGWRTLSPTEPFTEGSPYGDDEFDKAIIIMTDGDNTFDTDDDEYSGYGRANATSNPPGAQHSSKLNCGSQNSCENRINQRETTVCNNIKAAGIIVFTVGFDLTEGSTALTLLSNCATDSSKFFNSPTNEDLKEAFKQIGNELSNLRIGQ